jgi:hypothetical protein
MSRSRSALAIEKNFDTFDNVLYVNHAPNSCCLFGDQDHVRTACFFLNKEAFIS